MRALVITGAGSARVEDVAAPAPGTGQVAVDVRRAGGRVDPSRIVEVTVGLEDAEAQGFVLVRQDERRMDARLAHPVYGEALRQSLPRSRLRRISALLAGAVEADDVQGHGRQATPISGRVGSNER